MALGRCVVEFCSLTINIDINRYGDSNQKLMVLSTQVRILHIENWDKLGSSCDLLGWTFKNIRSTHKSERIRFEIKTDL